MNPPQRCLTCFGTGSKNKTKILETMEQCIKRAENSSCVETQEE